MNKAELKAMRKLAKEMPPIVLEKTQHLKGSEINILKDQNGDPIDKDKFYLFKRPEVMTYREHCQRLKKYFKKFGKDEYVVKYMTWAHNQNVRIVQKYPSILNYKKPTGEEE